VFGRKHFRRMRIANIMISERARMIIDAHVHLKHGDAARTEYNAATIVRIMDAVGMDRSVVFAMSTSTQHSIEMAQEAVEQYPERLIPFVYALPHYERPVIKELAAALEAGFRGIKLHIGECRLTDYIVPPVLRLAAEKDVPCLIDFGGDLATAERLSTDFPHTKIIIAHFGRYLSTDPQLLRAFVALAARLPNVWLDASGLVLPWMITEAARRIGAERILFGTDGPHSMPDLFTYAREALKQIYTLELGEEEKAMILGGAASQLLKLT